MLTKTWDRKRDTLSNRGASKRRAVRRTGSAGCSRNTTVTQDIPSFTRRNFHQSISSYHPHLPTLLSHRTTHPHTNRPANQATPHRPSHAGSRTSSKTRNGQYSAPRRHLLSSGRNRYIGGKRPHRCINAWDHYIRARRNRSQVHLR